MLDLYKKGLNVMSFVHSVLMEVFFLILGIVAKKMKNL